MADLVTRIIADDKQFNEKIEQSKRTVKGFSVEANKAGVSTNKMASAAAASFGKMLGAAGAAAVSYKTLQGAIESTDRTSDKFAVVIEQSRASLDHFLTSVATADFAGFWRGLSESTRLAREFYNTMDDLGDRRLGFSIRSAEINSVIKENRAILNDPYSTEDEKSTALAILKTEEEKLKELTGVIRDASRNAADALISNAANTTFSSDEIEKFKDYLAGTEYELKALETERERLKKIYASGSGGVVPGGGFQGPTFIEQTEESKEAEAALKSLEEKNKADIDFLEKINRLNTKEREDWAKLEQEYAGYSSQLSDLSRVINREAQKRVGGGKGAKIDVIPAGSFAELDKKLQEARKAFANATTKEARVAADLLIKELEAKKTTLEVQFKYTAPEDIKQAPVSPIRVTSKLDALMEVDRLNIELDKAEVKLKNAFDAESIKKAEAEVRKLKEDIETIKEHHDIKIEIKRQDDGEANLDGPLFGIDLSLPGAWNALMDEMYSKNLNTISSFYGMGEALGDIGNMLGENGKRWLNWSGDILTSISQAIPALTALTAAKGASSVADIPVAGPILAIGAIASILAAFASIPKFEHGGIVPGGSFSGDNMLARVNSGEMILNRGQQSKLFNIINGSGGGVSRSIRVGGEFRLRGKDLVAALEQEKKIQSRGGSVSTIFGK